MAIILARPPISSITSSGESHRMALSIAFQVLKIFVLDCKSFVARAVRRSIARQIAAPLPLRDHGNSRQQALTSWMNEEYALSWAEGTSTTPTTYRYLLTLLAEDPTQPKGGLVKSSEKWNYTRIAQHMVEHGVNGFAPVVKNGYFHTALALASVEIKKYAPNPAQADQWLISVLANTMQKEKIHFVPWHPASERRGTTKRLAVHTHWLFLDHRSTQSPHATSQTIDNPSPRATLTRIAVQDSSADPCAPWSLPTSMQNMGILWNKTTLPLDWNITHATLSSSRTPATEYVPKTYEFVRDLYDGNNWRHHLGLVLSILILPLLPLVFTSEEAKYEVGRANGTPAITRAIRGLPWIASTSATHRGTTAVKPYLTMLSTAIIGILDERAPLHIYANRYNKIGTPWTNKHGMFTLQSLYRTPPLIDF